MSARQPFVPSAPSRPVSRATFAPDQGNPLHQNSGPIDTSAQADLKQQNFARKLADMGQMDINKDKSNSGGPYRTAGLAGLMKKKSQVAGAAGPVGGNARPLANSTVRPGTADPHSLMYRASTLDAKFPIVAPTPQQFNSLASSPLLSRSRSGAGSVSFSASSHAFKVPSLEFINGSTDTSGKKAHTLTLDGFSGLDKTSDHREGAFSGNGSDEHQQGDELKNGTRTSFILDQGNPNGPRRVVIQPESHQYNRMEDCSSNFNGIQGHELTEDGRIKAVNPRKRVREECEQDDDSFRFENPPKRYRGQQNDMDNAGESSLFSSKFSPHPERPSSGVSHPLNPRRSQSIHGSPFVERSSRAPEDLKSNSPRKLQAYEGYDMQELQQSQQSQSESNTLEKLLGQDPNVYVRDHMDVYDDLVNKWTNCTMDEWIAGANEITLRYNEMLDHVKDFVGTKLKLYGTLHKNVDDHNSLLQQRNEILNAVKRKLVQESGSVLGK